MQNGEIRVVNFKRYKMMNVTIVIPIFNDWASFVYLIAEVDKVMSTQNCSINILAVDDGSYELLNEAEIANTNFNTIKTIEIIKLACNLGHQKAIAHRPRFGCKAFRR